MKSYCITVYGIPLYFELETSAFYYAAESILYEISNKIEYDLKPEFIDIMDFVENSDNKSAVECWNKISKKEDQYFIDIVDVDILNDNPKFADKFNLDILESLNLCKTRLKELVFK